MQYNNLTLFHGLFTCFERLGLIHPIICEQNMAHMAQKKGGEAKKRANEHIKQVIFTSMVLISKLLFGRSLVVIG